MSATIVLDRGADITSLIYRPRHVDVLSKARRAMSTDVIGAEPSEAEWHLNYPGGWQTILPNFGPAHDHAGRRLPMHGEAARVPWSLEDSVADGERDVVTVVARLQIVPLHVRRIVEVVDDQPKLRVTETITNVGDQPVECMWGHHPAFGPPFLSPGCVVDTGARTIEPDPGYDDPAFDLSPGARSVWPMAASKLGDVDLSRMPPPGAGSSRVVTLLDFEQPWYSITNPDLGFGFGLAWSGEAFPYACMWQESGGIKAPPLSGDGYVLAIEPQSSYPGHGLAAVVRSTGTQLTLAAGEERSASLCAVFYEGGERVTGIDLDGSVRRR